jgi:hypothetical protein
VGWKKIGVSRNLVTGIKQMAGTKCASNYLMDSIASRLRLDHGEYKLFL